MIILLYLLISLVLVFTDLKMKLIPNVIVLPAILAGCILTGNWIYALGMFVIGAILFVGEYWHGGDVKLITMVGAFLGIKALFIFLLSWGGIYLFRFLRNYRKPLPVTPFVFITSLFFIF